MISKNGCKEAAGNKRRIKNEKEKSFGALSVGSDACRSIDRMWKQRCKEKDGGSKKEETTKDGKMTISVMGIDWGFGAVSNSQMEQYWEERWTWIWILNG